MVQEPHHPSSVERVTIPLGSRKMKWKSVFGILATLIEDFFDILFLKTGAVQ